MNRNNTALLILVGFMGICLVVCTLVIPLADSYAREIKKSQRTGLVYFDGHQVHARITGIDSEGIHFVCIDPAYKPAEYVSRSATVRFDYDEEERKP